MKKKKKVETPYATNELTVYFPWLNTVCFCYFAGC